MGRVRRVCWRGATWGLCLVAALAAPCFGFAPEPMGKPPARSLKEDLELLVQKEDAALALGDGVDHWKGASAERLVYKDKVKEKRKCAPLLIFVRHSPGFTVEFNGDKDFFKRGAVSGILHYGIAGDAGGMRVHSTGFRLEQEGRRRYLVLPDKEGKEFRFEYELTQTTLNLKGAMKLKTTFAGELDVAGTLSRPVKKKRKDE